jgi:peroxiredoxin
MVTRRSLFLSALGVAALMLATACGGADGGSSASSVSEAPRVGSAVGDFAPDFTVTTTDGETVSLGNFIDSGTPVVLYFFASWCPICRSDMQVLKTVYPDYQAAVAFLAIDVDPSEDADLVDRYKQQQEYPWPMALYDPFVVSDYKIIAQASKVAINAEGVIVFRSGYGSLRADRWRDVLDLATEAG